MSSKTTCYPGTMFHNSPSSTCMSAESGLAKTSSLRYPRRQPRLISAARWWWRTKPTSAGELQLTNVEGCKAQGDFCHTKRCVATFSPAHHILKMGWSDLERLGQVSTEQSTKSWATSARVTYLGTCQEKRAWSMEQGLGAHLQCAVDCAESALL